MAMSMTEEGLERKSHLFYFFKIIETNMKNMFIPMKW